MRNPGRYAMTERLRRLMADEIWNIGVVDQPIADIARRGLAVPPRWVRALGPGRMLADPAFRARPDGGCTLYAEYLDYADGRGEIWSANLPAGADLATADFAPMLRFGHHASYPFPFDDDDGQPCLTMETWQANAAGLWADDGVLRRVGDLVPQRQVVDPTLWKDDGRWWLFCSLHDAGADQGLYLFHAKTLDGGWSAHPGNPVRTGPAGSRPAGPLFRVDGALVRPGQDCSRTYGGAVILHQVTRLDTEGYEETVMRRIDPPPGAFSAGLHTIVPAGAHTLIDGKRWRMSIPSARRKLKRKLAPAQTAKENVATI